jgi:hypothetical protein
MGKGQKSDNNKNSLKAIDKISWRKKFTAQVLGDLEFEHRSSEGSIDPEETEKEIAKNLIEQDNLENELGEYYDDQKKSDRKVLENYEEIYSHERVLSWIKCRWEFMRRSPDYIDAFEQESKIIEKEKPSFNLFKRFEFWKSFGLFCSKLPDPNLSFEELQTSEFHDMLEEPFFRLNFITKNYKSHAGISYFTYLDEKIDFKDFNKLHFIVDFTKVESIDALKRIISRLMDDYWDDYYGRVGQEKKVREKEEYELILKVGDLKDKEKLTYKEIAEKIFHDSESPKSAQEKVSFFYERYKYLINGGYRNI